MRALYLLAIIVFLIVASCGGEGGNPVTLPGTRPSISNLSVFPISALQNEGDGWIAVQISVDFVDREGDVYYMGSNVLSSSGSILYGGGTLLPQLAGQMSGTAHGTMRINTSELGQFTLRVWLVDDSIRQSNALDVQISII